MKKKKHFRIEFFEKGIYEFGGYREAKTWAKDYFPKEIRTLHHQRYFTLKEIKKDDKGIKDYSFTKEEEYNP